MKIGKNKDNSTNNVDTIIVKAGTVVYTADMQPITLHKDTKFYI